MALRRGQFHVAHQRVLGGEHASQREGAGKQTRRTWGEPTGLNMAIARHDASPC